MSPFHSRWGVSEPSKHGRTLQSAKAFPRLQWQLAVNRINRRHGEWRARVVPVRYTLPA